MESEIKHNLGKKLAPLTPVVLALQTSCQKFPNAKQELAAMGLIVVLGTIVYLGFRSDEKGEKESFNRALKRSAKKIKNHNERHWYIKDNTKK